MEDLNETEVPFTMGKFIYQLNDQEINFADQYISEVSISWFHDNFGPTEWSLNVASYDDRILVDLIGIVL